MNNDFIIPKIPSNSSNVSNIAVQSTSISNNSIESTMGLERVNSVLKKNLPDIGNSDQRQLDSIINIHNISLPKERSTPKPSLSDTVFINAQNNVSVHGQTKCFEDNEIIYIHQPIDSLEIPVKHKRKILIDIYPKNKHCFQQQAVRACSAAVRGYIKLDLGLAIDYVKQSRCTLTPFKTIYTNLRDEGISAYLKNPESIERLATLINKYDFAVAQINDPELGGHVLLVDNIDFDLGCITVREPYHGWIIDVTIEAFLSRWVQGQVIIVKNYKESASIA